MIRIFPKNTREADERLVHACNVFWTKRYAFWPGDGGEEGIEDEHFALGQTSYEAKTQREEKSGFEAEAPDGFEPKQINGFWYWIEAEMPF